MADSELMRRTAEAVEALNSNLSAPLAVAANPGSIVAVDSGAGGDVIAAANAARRSLLIKNTDTALTVWISLGGTPVAGACYPLGPGEFVNTDRFSGLYTGAVKGITASGTADVAVLEI